MLVRIVIKMNYLSLVLSLFILLLSSFEEHTYIARLFFCFFLSLRKNEIFLIDETSIRFVFNLKTHIYIYTHTHTFSFRLYLKAEEEKKTAKDDEKEEADCHHHREQERDCWALEIRLSLLLCMCVVENKYISWEREGW